MLRGRFGAGYRGEVGDKVLSEFDFGRGGRPVHIIPTNDGKYLLAFSNRAPDGALPGSDRLWFLDKDRYKENLVYDRLPKESDLAWPALERALAPPRPGKTKAQTLSYGFLSKESSPGCMLVARQAEGEGLLTELICFVVHIPEGGIELPETSELLILLARPEPLFRAGAAWALGAAGDKQHQGAIRDALAGTHDGAARAAIARALVRCGDRAGRKTLHALLGEKDAGVRREAALALTRLAADPRDGDALAGALADGDPRTAELCGMALARLGKAGLAAAVKASRSASPRVRAAVAITLGRMGSADAERRLLALARDTDPVVQQAAAVALTNPPRAILADHHAEFARVLDACRRSRNAKASRRLCTLAAHAGIAHEKVLKALVDLAAIQPRAIWALRKLSGEELETAKDCKNWWKARS